MQGILLCSCILLCSTNSNTLDMGMQLCLQRAAVW